MNGLTPIPCLLGGALLGLSASMLLLSHGRIAGVSGILGGLVARKPADTAWRAYFAAGLLAGGAVLATLWPAAFAVLSPRSTVVLAAAGLLVGIGTQLGNGCTSGHGVCGLSRFSLRSLIATMTFMTTGAITVYVVSHALGGP